MRQLIISYLELKNPNPYFYESNSGVLNTANINYEVKSSAYGIFFRFPANGNDFVLKKGGVDLSENGVCGVDISCSSQTSNFGKYTSTELNTPTNKCEIYFNPITQKISSNLKPLQTNFWKFNCKC